MISIAQEPNYIHVIVAGKFALEDYREFESAILQKLQAQSSLNLLFDLREMQGYTIDMALEDVRFTKAHRQDLAHIAVVTDDQWVLWSAWLNRMLADAEIRVFDQINEAKLWVSEPVVSVGS